MTKAKKQLKKKPAPKKKARTPKPTKPLSVADILRQREEKEQRENVLQNNSNPTPGDSKNLPPLPRLNSDLSTLKHTAEYLEFIEWQALPKSEREPETLGDMAKKVGVGIDTLIDWKKRTGFWEDVRDARRVYIKDDMLGLALLCLKKKILKEGNASEVKLLFQLADEFEEKSSLEIKKTSRLTEEQKAGFAERLKRWKNENL